MFGRAAITLDIGPHFQLLVCVCVEGANVYAKSRTGVTALTEAAANGHTEIVNILNRHLLSAKSDFSMLFPVSCSVRISGASVFNLMLSVGHSCTYAGLRA